MFHLLLIVLGMFFSVLACAYIGISETMGYLIGGILMGPCVGGWLQADQSVLGQASELSITFFLFTIGLELPLERLRSLAGSLVMVGGAQVFPSAVCLILAFRWAYAWPWLTCCFLGTTLALSSTALVVRLLSEERPLEAHQTWKIIFPILLFQDVIAIALFVVLNIVNTTFSSTHSFSWIPLLQGVGLLSFMFKGMQVILRRPSWQNLLLGEKPEVTLPFLLILILAFAYVSEHCGLSSELGAFLAGSVCAEAGHSERIEHTLHPLVLVCTASFFLNIGAKIDIGLLRTHGWHIVGFILIFFSIKMSVLLLMGRSQKMSWPKTLKMAVPLTGASEFTFIVISFSQALRGIDDLWMGILTTSSALSLLGTGLIWTFLKSLWKTADVPWPSPEDMMAFPEHASVSEPTYPLSLAAPSYTSQDF